MVHRPGDRHPSREAVPHNSADFAGELLENAPRLFVVASVRLHGAGKRRAEPADQFS